VHDSQVGDEPYEERKDEVWAFDCEWEESGVPVVSCSDIHLIVETSSGTRSVGVFVGSSWACTLTVWFAKSSQKDVEMMQVGGIV
jgi:hypothetical protein